MILEEIFRGNFTPLDVVSPADPEYWAANQKAADLTEALIKQLPPEQKKLLDELLEQIYTAQCRESEAFFSFGFASGVQLQKEVKEQMTVFDA